MSDAGTTTANISAALALIPVDAKKARDQLLSHAHDRLKRLASWALNGYRPLRDRGVQTDDIVHSLYVRLLSGWDKTLAGEDGQPTRDPAVFLRRVSFLLRKVLGDELRRFNGRPANKRRPAKPIVEVHEGQVASPGEKTAVKLQGERIVDGSPSTPIRTPEEKSRPAGNRRPKLVPLNPQGEEHAGGHDPATDTFDPVRLAVFAEFHQAVDELPEDLRAVVDLRYYQELTHAEVGGLLGLTEVAARKRWVRARLALIDRLGSNPFLEGEG